MSKFICLVLFVTVVVNLCNVHADSEEERAALEESVKTIMVKCAKEYGVTGGDDSDEKKDAKAEDLNPCLLNCLLSQVGIFKDGKFDVATSLHLSKIISKNDEDYAEHEKVIKKCQSVNDEPVSDGDAGCERALLLYKCYMKLIPLSKGQ